MLGVTGFLAMMCFGFLIYAKWKDIEILPSAKDASFGALAILPLLFLAFFLAGLVQKVIPPHVVASWVGESAGWRGLFIGSIAGALAPGGPFVSFPLVVILMKAGASVGTLIAFITGWSLLAINRIPMEVGIIGWKFVFVRLACTFFVPPLVGLVAQLVFKGIQWRH